MNNLLDQTKVLLATANRSKITELSLLLADFQLQTMASARFIFGGFSLDEPGPDYRANAANKALVASQRTGLVTLSDDSGIEVDALAGEPGFLSARYAGERCE